MTSVLDIPIGFTGTPGECNSIQSAGSSIFSIGSVSVSGGGGGTSLTYSIGAVKSCTSKDAYPWEVGIDSSYIDFQSPGIVSGTGFTRVSCNRTSQYLITGD